MNLYCNKCSNFTNEIDINAKLEINGKIIFILPVLLWF